MLIYLPKSSQFLKIHKILLQIISRYVFDISISGIVGRYPILKREPLETLCMCSSGVTIDKSTALFWNR
jgi:hypothetical protein